jgi:hypothetical protein
MTERAPRYELIVYQTGKRIAIVDNDTMVDNAPRELASLDLEHNRDATDTDFGNFFALVLSLGHHSEEQIARFIQTVRGAND